MEYVIVESTPVHLKGVDSCIWKIVWSDKTGIQNTISGQGATEEEAHDEALKLLGEAVVGNTRSAGKITRGEADPVYDKISKLKGKTPTEIVAMDIAAGGLIWQTIRAKIQEEKING